MLYLPLEQRTAHLIAEIMAGMGEQEHILSLNNWSCWDSLSPAETQACRAGVEERFSSNGWSWPANLPAVGASMSGQLISTRVLAYDNGALHTDFCCVDRMRWISSGSLDAWLLSGLL